MLEEIAKMHIEEFFQNWQLVDLVRKTLRAKVFSECFFIFILVVLIDSNVPNVYLQLQFKETRKIVL